MNDNNKDSEPVSVGFNERQSTYLQRLGLKTLLERSFPKTVTELFKRFWVHRTTILVFGLGVYSVTASFNVATINQELKESRTYMADQIDANNELTWECSQICKKGFQIGPSEAEMLEEILRLTGTDGDINKPIGLAGGNIIFKSMNKGVPGEFLDFCILHGADVNFQRDSGNTPLHIGIYRGAYEQVLHLLINHRDKIDLTLTNHHNRTFFQTALLKFGRPGAAQDPILGEIIALQSNPK